MYKKQCFLVFINIEYFSYHNCISFSISLIWITTDVKSFQLTGASQSGANGLCVTIRAEDLWSTEVEHAPTPLPLPMGNRVLVMHSKRNLNVSGRVQVSKSPHLKDSYVGISHQWCEMNVIFLIVNSKLITSSLKLLAFTFWKDIDKNWEKVHLTGFFKYQYEDNSRLLIKLMIVNWQGYLWDFNLHCAYIVF